MAVSQLIVLDKILWKTPTQSRIQSLVRSLREVLWLGGSVQNGKSVEIIDFYRMHRGVRNSTLGRIWIHESVNLYQNP